MNKSTRTFIYGFFLWVLGCAGVASFIKDVKSEFTLTTCLGIVFTILSIIVIVKGIRKIESTTK